MIFRLITLLFVFFCYSIFAANAMGLVLPQDLPKPKYINTQTGNIIKVGTNTKIHITQNLNQKYTYLITELTSILSGLHTQNNGVSSINIKILNPASRSYLSQYASIALQHKEGYYIDISEANISIYAPDEAGIVNGITTFEAILQSNYGNLELTEIADWPDLNIRALHFALHRGTTADDIKSLIIEARKHHFNTLIIMLMDGVKFKSMSKLYRDDALSIDEFKNIIAFANDNGIEVIPEIKLLTHQEKHLFKKAYPDLMFNEYTYDPTNPEVYKIIFPMIDEIIKVMHPQSIHIGHDEVVGVAYKKKYPELKIKVLPAELFLTDVVKINSYLKQKNVTTMMWGDMLISPDKFPTMNPAVLNGINGYAELSNQIPKDIIICDWHYWDKQQNFPSAKAFVDSGHRVLGATWGANIKNDNVSNITIKNFSNYIASMQKNNLGMIATTWFQIKNKEKIVNNIIQVSGEAFWNAK